MTASLQDEMTEDGTTSTVLIGEFLKQADMYITEGLHPRFTIFGKSFKNYLQVKVKSRLYLVTNYIMLGCES